MASINLRPWRQELREQKKQDFLMVLVGMVVLAALVVFIGDRYLNGAIDYQNSRNAYLKQEIAVLDKKIREIRELKKRRAELLARMQVIQELQGNRPLIVRVFDELVRTLPGGVFYKEVRTSGNSITINGTAESNTKVSSLLRKLDASDWFGSPLLSGVKANPNFGEQANDFNLRVGRTTPKSESDKENK